MKRYAKKFKLIYTAFNVLKRHKALGSIYCKNKTTVLWFCLIFNAMRIWSLHPKYLDTKGLVALWRETLLAKHVLEGKTKGYKHHPQLYRFKQLTQPVDAINAYLYFVYEEAAVRRFQFDSTKFAHPAIPQQLLVNEGQLRYEFNHLLSKLKSRDAERYHQIKAIQTIEPHPIFTIVEGGVEKWEIT